MIGLVLKDIYNLNKYINQFGFSFLVLLILSVYLKSPYYLMGMVIMMSSMMVITTMGYDETARWDKYALTMPILKKDIVMGKYILLVLTSLLGAISSGVIAFVMAIVMKIPDPLEILLSSIAIALVMVLIFSILLPLLFKLGVEKARIVMLAAIGIPTFLIMGLVNLMKKYNIPYPSKEQIKILIFAFPVIVLIGLFLSFNCSLAILNKKEL